ncbi:metallophosphoesterase [Gemmatimonadota bacterium]
MNIGTAALIGLGVGLIGWEIWRSGRIRFRRHEIKLKASDLGGAAKIRILHLSDLHITRASGNKLDQIAFLLEQQWDFVMVSGDLIDDDSGIFPVCAFLSRLNAAYGKYAVLGNHDYHLVRSRNPLHWVKVFVAVAILGKPENYCVPNDIGLLARTLEEQGIKLLRNELAEGELSGGGRFQVFGIDDPSTGRDDPVPLYPLAGQQALRLVMTHSPRRIGLLEKLQPAIVLCGHTHGGQIRLPFFGALATHSDAGRKTCSGLVKMDGCRVHISPGFGTGHLFPLRFLAQAEVTEIILKASE